MIYNTAKELFETARSRVTRDWIENHFAAPGSEWRGSDFFTINPLRDDTHVGSFSISETGWYSDFADNNTYGDVFQLLAKTSGGRSLDYASEMAGGTLASQSLRFPQQPAPAPSAPVPELKPPTPDVVPWAPLPAYDPPGQANLVTRFCDPETGREVFAVCRRDTEEGKEIRPWYFNGEKYVPGIPKGYPFRPLLSLKYPTAPVLVVEGEKCAAAAQKYFDTAGLLCSVTTWHGGGGSYNKVEVSPLVGKTVVFWPDNDDVGRDAMRTLEKKIAGTETRTHIMFASGCPDATKGWDIADAILEGFDVASEVKNAIGLCRPRLPEVIEERDEEEPSDPLYQPNMAASLKDYMLTDLGNAERLVALFGDRIRYNYDKGCWMVCRDFTWEGNDPAAITPMIKATIQNIGRQDPKFAFKCESGKAISSMLSLASREPGIPVREPAFDRNPDLFHCSNGLLDVRKGELVEGKPDMLISKTADVEFDPAATCPRFLQFLDEITMGRPEIAGFFKRWFGVSLSGDTSVQSFAIFFGHGANGKSTLTELIARILGDYAKNAPPETFTVKTSGSGIPNDVAALRGARMVMATETEASARLAESKIKSLTGGDMVSARYMRGEFFEFLPSWKIIISTNHKPRISGADHGIWRRIILVPFDFVATTESMDPLLGQKLWAERSGILNWMLEGAREFFAAGGGRAALKVPDVMLAETTEYRVEEDVVGRFLAEECYTKEEAARLMLPAKVSAKAVHNAFKLWCESNNEMFAARMTSIGFGKAMKDRNIEQCRLSDGSRGYLNVFPRDNVYNQGGHENE